LPWYHVMNAELTLAFFHCFELPQDPACPLRSLRSYGHNLFYGESAASSPRQVNLLVLSLKKEKNRKARRPRLLNLILACRCLHAALNGSAHSCDKRSTQVAIGIPLRVSLTGGGADGWCGPTNTRPANTFISVVSRSLEQAAVIRHAYKSVEPAGCSSLGLALASSFHTQPSQLTLKALQPPLLLRLLSAVR